MNDVANIGSSPITPATMEHVLGTGDLSKLSTQQRVAYYGNVCESVGLNPLTRPFRFLSFQGQTVLYATKDAVDQIRRNNNVSVEIVDKSIDDDLFIVTARATMPNGRSDEDVGAVTIGNLKGEARANAIQKAMTKAKRRVTLSICGLGWMHEGEAETLHGATSYDVDSGPPRPVTPIRDITPAKPAQPALAAPAAPAASQPLVAEATTKLENEFDPRKWMSLLERYVWAAVSREELGGIWAIPSVSIAIRSAPPGERERIKTLFRNQGENIVSRTREKVPTPAPHVEPLPEPLPEPDIEPQDVVDEPAYVLVDASGDPLLGYTTDDARTFARWLAFELKRTNNPQRFREANTDAIAMAWEDPEARKIIKDALTAHQEPAQPVQEPAPPVERPVTPPADDEALVARVIHEVAALNSSAEITEWSKGPIKAALMGLRARNLDAFTRAVAAVDQRGMALEG